MLEASLTDLVRVYTVHRAEEVVESDSESESASVERKMMKDVHLMRPRMTQPSAGSPLPFANGCGTSAGSIYTGALLAVLDQAEVCQQVFLPLCDMVCY